MIKTKVGKRIKELRNKLGISQEAKHEVHSQHGFASSKLLQLSALARILAIVVLPVPRGPLNK